MLSCSKVNYKLNYQPGYLICPLTKKLIPFEQAKPELERILSMSFAEKKKLLGRQRDIRLNVQEQSQAPFDLQVEKDMEEWLMSQKIWK